MSSTRWLDEREQRAWRAYVQMHARLNAHLNRQLQDAANLSLADYGVLVRLADAPCARLRVFELGSDLQWEQSRLSHQLTRMQRRGLVGREECPQDRRGAFVVLTDAGRRALEQAAPGHVEAVRRLLFDGLTPEQVTLLEQLATRVLDRLAAEGEEGSTTCG